MFNTINILLSSPLDQFDTLPLFEQLLLLSNKFFTSFYYINLMLYNVNIFNALIFVFIGCYFSLIGFKFLYRQLIYGKLLVFRKLIIFVFDLVKEIVRPIKLTRKQYLNFSTFIFMSILTKNCYSQLPASKAATATIQLPFSYSITFCVGFNLLFILKNRPIEALTFFIPSAIPLEMSPFLWIIELISHLIKVISLAVRLCANIFSGHVLLDTILTALFLIFVKGGASLFIFFITFQVIGFAIQLLETFIGFLQAFVFLTLTSIYTAEIFGGEH